MTPSELKAKVLEHNPQSRFFSRENMKFSGDTMRNYGVFPDTIDTPTDKGVPVWVLWRKWPVKHGLQSNAYFRADDFRQTFKAK